MPLTSRLSGLPRSSPIEPIEKSSGLSHWMNGADLISLSGTNLDVGTFTASRN